MANTVEITVTADVSKFKRDMDLAADQVQRLEKELGAAGRQITDQANRFATAGDRIATALRRQTDATTNAKVAIERLTKAREVLNKLPDDSKKRETALEKEANAVRGVERALIRLTEAQRGLQRAQGPSFEQRIAGAFRGQLGPITPTLTNSQGFGSSIAGAYLPGVGAGASIAGAGAALAAFAGYQGYNYVRESLQFARERQSANLELASATRLAGGIPELAENEANILGYSIGVSGNEARRIQASGLRYSRFIGRRDSDDFIRSLADLNAANGNQTDTATLAGQIFRGEDEGFDKIGLRSYNSYYAERAKQLGTTTDKLDDVTKAEVRYQAVLKAGQEVRGAAQKFQETDIGQLDKLSRKFDEAKTSAGGFFASLAVGYGYSLDKLLHGEFKAAFAPRPGQAPSETSTERGTRLGRLALSQNVLASANQRYGTLYYQSGGLNGLSSDATAEQQAAFKKERVEEYQKAVQNAQEALVKYSQKETELNKKQIAAFKQIGTEIQNLRIQYTGINNPLVAGGLQALAAIKALRDNLLDPISPNYSKENVAAVQAEVLQLQRNASLGLANGVASQAAQIAEVQSRIDQVRNIRAGRLIQERGQYGQLVDTFSREGGSYQTGYKTQLQRGYYGQLTGGVDVIRDEDVFKTQELADKALKTGEKFSRDIRDSLFDGFSPGEKKNIAQRFQDEYLVSQFSRLDVDKLTVSQRQRYQEVLERYEQEKIQAEAQTLSLLAQIANKDALATLIVKAEKGTAITSTSTAQAGGGDNSGNPPAPRYPNGTAGG